MNLKTVNRIPTYGCLIVAVLCVLSIQGCAATSPEANARSLMDRLEFGEDEIGCVDLRATVDLNPIPLITTNASLILKKSKGQNPPEC